MCKLPKFRKKVKKMKNMDKLKKFFTLTKKPDLSKTTEEYKLLYRSTIACLKTAEEIQTFKQINLSTIAKLAKETHIAFENYIKKDINGKDDATSTLYWNKYQSALEKLQHAINSYQQSFFKTMKYLTPILPQLPSSFDVSSTGSY